jgi:hypothetical protein
MLNRSGDSTKVASAVAIILVSVFTCSSLIASAAAGARPTSCPLQSEKPMVIAHLFFGRAIQGRGPLTDAEWSSFAASVLSRDFPDGFTAYDGEGQWLDPQTGKIVRERSKVVVIAAKEDERFAKNIRDAADAYRKTFHQHSVGVISQTACAAF